MKKVEKEMTEARQRERAWFKAVYVKDIETIQGMIAEGIDVNITTTPNRWTALYLACWFGSIDIAKLLIDNRADITFKDKDGSIPLDELKSYPKQYEELMQWLTEEHPEKMLELMASKSVQGKGVGL